MKLSPELVSFLLALRGVRQSLEGNLGCFGLYAAGCTRHVRNGDYPACIICDRMLTEEGTDWIDELLKAYPGE